VHPQLDYAQIAVTAPLVIDIGGSSMVMRPRTLGPYKASSSDQGVDTELAPTHNLHAVRDGVFVHEQGLCESETVGLGTQVWAFAHVLPGARIGRDCNICDGVFVEGEAVIGDRVTVKNQVLVWDRVEIGDDCFLGPGVVFTNDRNPRSSLREGNDHLLATKIGPGTTIGANSTIICGVEIGTHAFIGAGSVVCDDLPGHAFALGNPARQIGWACLCGNRLDEELACRDCGRRYRLDEEDQLIALVDGDKPA